MAHFAELDENNTVLRVIVVSNENCKDAEGNESEIIGAEFCSNLFGGKWIQTSYNNNFRVRYAGIGYKYDTELDEFVEPTNLFIPHGPYKEETLNAPTPCY